MDTFLERILTLHPQINTPALIVDAERMHENIRAMQNLADENQKNLRPHLKTHKSVLIARQQLEMGAAGVTVAKLGEAEVMAEAGIIDIFIANQITHPRKLRKLCQMHDAVRLSVGLDHMQQIYLYAAYFTNPDHPLDIMIEIDSGLQRCGVNPGEDLLNLARTVQDQPGLHLKGIFTHAGQVYSARSQDEINAIAEREGNTLQEAFLLLQKNRIRVESVSAGSTPTAPFVVKNPAVTEIRPGNYIFYDGIQVSLGCCKIEKCALFVLATVISQPEANRIVIDAGSKSLHLDQGAHSVKLLSGFGDLMNLDGTLERLSEEHGMIRLLSAVEIQLGSPVIILPNHACAVTNLYDYYYLVENDGSFQLLNIDARGKSQ